MNKQCQTDEIKELMNQNVFDGRIRERGLQIVSFNVESVTFDDESNKNIQNYNLSANTNLQQGTLTGAYANAVEKAASNPNGAMNGFMGIGMTNMASNGMFGSAITNASSDKKDEDSKTESQIWFCTNCGTKNSGKFCMNCGKAKEESIKKD